MLRIIYFLLCISLACFSACKPEVDIIPVPDNTAPPDRSVPEVVKANYVNKCYITLLGRKATEAEFSAGMSLLSRDNALLSDRQAFLDGLLSKPDYSQRQYDIARIEILNNLDTAEITFQIAIYAQLAQLPEYQPFLDIIYAEIAKMQALKNIPADLEAGTLNRIDMHRRFVNNFFYDEINMGTQNFILGTFEYFLKRYPTDTELARATTMIDGFEAILFGAEGKDKDDFLQIFFMSDDYLEGQILNVYEDFLFRPPTSYEMGIKTQAYRSHLSYKNVLRDILSTDEFLGI